MNKFLSIFFAAALMFSCSDNDIIDNSTNGQKAQKEAASTQSVQLSINQAQSYAKLFYKGLQVASTPDGQTRASQITIPTIKNIDFLVEGKDTLLYAINYNDNRGYILLAGANTSFPIIAHSDMGNIDFNNISKDNPLNLVISNYKEKIKKELQDKDAASKEYFNEWKDLGKPGYEYEIELNNPKPTPDASTRARRKYSSGKSFIFPAAGLMLDKWNQSGGYNYFAENKALIGCPAMAIGMLLYDTAGRPGGQFLSVYPDFNQYDIIEEIDKGKPTPVAEKLRKVADEIPNYSWGKEEGAQTSAMPNDVLIALHKLGYINAEQKPYNLEELYNNLTFTAINEFGRNQDYTRGVLIGAFSFSGKGGHIWFCDGYCEERFTVKKKSPDNTIKEWKEYEDYLYMNWGWGTNNGNGWYSATDYNGWHSVDGYRPQDFKLDCQMFVNLSTYVRPNK